MTVQNKMAVLLMSGGLSEVGSANEKTFVSKTAKTETFNEVFKTADRSNAGMDRVEKNDRVSTTNKPISTKESSSASDATVGNEREKLLKSVFEKVISGNEETSPEDEIVVTDELMALLQSLVQNVSEQLQGILGMSEEQLDLAVRGLGMTEMDLLDPNSITELVVQLKANGDFAELISNEELHKEVTSLFNMLETEMDGMAEELGLTSEQFEQIIDKAMDNENFIDGFAGNNEKQSNTLLTADIDGTQENVSKVTVDKSENGEASRDNASQNNSTLLGDVIANLEQKLATVTDEPQAVQIVRQVIEQIQINAREGMTSMEIQLTPENLGKVNLQVTAKDGVVTAQITTDTLAAKEAIEAQINVLRESLNEQGLKVEAVEVTVESHKFESGSEQNREPQQEESDTGRRYIDLENAEEIQFEDTAAALAREIMMSNGNRMDIVT